MPPEPFLYHIGHTNYFINLTNYGLSLLFPDARDVLIEAQVEIDEEIEIAGGRDAVLESSRVWSKGTVMMTLRPDMLMFHETAGLVLEGLLEWGVEYEFLEADMTFLERGPWGWETVGWGELVDSSESRSTARRNLATD